MIEGSLTDKEQQWLEHILKHYGNAQAIGNFAELDGFLTAVLSGPRAIEPDVWLVALWGGEKQIPQWKNERELTRFMNLAFQHLNHLADTLSDYPEQFQPIYSLDSQTLLAPAGLADWCSGYMRGVGLTDWSSLPLELKPVLATLESQQNDQPQSDPNGIVEQDTAIIAAQIRKAALALHDYWLTQPEALPVVQHPIVRAATPGRNDPCSCGSGKKFKKCCGA